MKHGKLIISVVGGREMYYKLYIDTFFIQEFVINFYVLLLCKICFIGRVRYRRIALAAAILAGYQTSMLFVPFPQHPFLFFLMLWILNVVGAYYGVRVCFGKNSAVVYIKQIAVYMIWLLIIGGFFVGILPRVELFRESSVKGIFFIVIGGAVYIVLKWLFGEKQKIAYYGKMQIRHRDRVLEGQYFMDSGNSLVESISKKPVLLAHEKWLFEKIKKDELFSRPIVYKSVGKNKGILYAYCVDEIIIYGKNGAYTYEKVWIGVCREDLFSGKDYQIILPPFYGG